MANPEQPTYPGGGKPAPKPAPKPKPAPGAPPLAGLVHVTDPNQARQLEREKFKLIDYMGGQYYDPDQEGQGSHLYNVSTPAEARALEAAGFKVTDQGRGQVFQSFGHQAPGTVAASPNGGLASSQKDAWAQLQQTLQTYGFTGADLTALIAWAKGEIIAGNSAAQISLDLMKTPQFEKRFPAISVLEQQGVAITPAEYISIEQAYAQAEQAAGIPPNFSDFDKLIASQVSPTEFANRLNQGYLAVENAPPEVLQEFQKYNNVTKGDLVAYFLDPKNAEPLLLQKAQAAQIGGAAHVSGFGDINGQQALRLAQQGVTYSQAQTGFQKLAEQQQLYSLLPGQGQRYGFTQNNLLGAEFGSDGQTAQQLQLQADFEKGTTNQGVGVTQTQQGLQGAGGVQR